MKKLVITTIILLLATAYITVVYFKDLNPPGSNTSRVIRTIPDNAAIIFGFNNEKSFYDIFNGDTLLTAVVGQQKLSDIDTLRSRLLDNPLLQKYLDGQNIFISLHPLKNNDVDLLLTMSAVKGFDISMIDQLSKQQNSGLVITAMRFDGKPGYEIYLNALKKRFYIVNTEENIFSGSFSVELAQASAQYKPKSDKKTFVLLSEQQNTNSLANLYVNYEQLSPLFEKIFKSKNTDMFRSFRLLPALAVLGMNYRSDAFMFSGISTVKDNVQPSYLGLFTDQQPVINHLKDIFPATTAYSTNFSVSEPAKFAKDLSRLYQETENKNEKNKLFNKIKTETGVNLETEFDKLLDNEFAVVTTRYEEKFAIISVKNGSKLGPLMMNISHMTTNDIGQFNYDKVPYYLLGDAFSVFKRPYFIIMDNYLILANSATELTSYNDTYFNRKFLNKMEQYGTFNNLLSERSNVTFYINFKNAQPILKNELNPDFYEALEKYAPGWKNFYAASYQFSANDKNLYTNFCMKLNNIDTTAVKR